MDPQRLIPGDATLIENIVNYLKAKGIFDEFRHECLADVDTKSSYQNLSQRVDGSASKFLSSETWHPDLNKNETRNKLRRNIEESGIFELGSDHVVEQVINPKVHQMFLPKIIEVVHQYVKEQTELFNKKQERSSSERTLPGTSDSKTKTSISDPIADILSFSYSKSKTAPSSPHIKAESTQQKHTDLPKLEKKREEKPIPAAEKRSADLAKVEKKKDEKPIPTIEKTHADLPKVEKKKEDKAVPAVEKIPADLVKVEKKKEEKCAEKSHTDVKVEKKAEEEESHMDVSKVESMTEKNDLGVATENATYPLATEPETETDKEKFKKEEPEISQEVSEKAVKEELKYEKKTEVEKVQSSEAVTPTEENKASVSPSIKPTLSKKEFQKNTQKLKAGTSQKSSNSSNEIKKHKKESSDKSEKASNSKSAKSLKESPSSSKNVSSIKSVLKEEKGGDSSKSRSSDSSSSKTSESSGKHFSKSSSITKDSSSKHKGHSEKTDKSKISKSSDKTDRNINYDSSNSEKVTKALHYSSSYDSSQGSDQERSLSSSSKNRRQKHFSKHAKKEKSEEDSDKSSRTLSDPKGTSDVDESPKNTKSEKFSKLEKSKDTALDEAVKLSYRSNSFGSTSSVSSSSNTSRDNLLSNSDEVSESPVKGKKKKEGKEKDSCHDPNKTLPPPPPPPPSSSSALCDLTSPAELSSIEDAQSSSVSEASSSEGISEESSSDSESEAKDAIINVLNAKTSTMLNNVFDIFLYSSSSSEFDGFSPIKKRKTISFPEQNCSDINVSSVHTSDLSSFDDEISDDDFSNASQPSGRKKLTLKEAQALLQNKAALQERYKYLMTEEKINSTPNLVNTKSAQKSSPVESSDEEPTPSEPTRSLRRERKLNPRYASSEYTSIFNSRKETFITKQSIPSMKNSSYNASPSSESKNRKKESSEKIKSPKKFSLDNKTNAVKPKEAEYNHSPSPDSKNNKRETSLEKIKFRKKSCLEDNINSDQPKEVEYNPAPSSESKNSRKETSLKKIKFREEYSLKNDKTNTAQPKEVECNPSSSELKNSKNEAPLENIEPPRESSLEDAVSSITQPKEIEQVKEIENVLHNIEKELSDMSGISSSDEMDSIMNKEIFQENNKPTDISDKDHLTVHLKLKLNNTSNLNMNSYSLKRKLAVADSLPAKRPCSRSSVDSSSSEFTPNENKPFNSEKPSTNEDKMIRDGSLKGSDLIDGIRKDLFSKQRTNNNGDILGQKDIFPKNSHAKSVNNAENKINECDASKELSAL